MCALGIIMYYPKAPEQQEELAKRVAQIHAQTVIEQVKALSCPVEQKVKLINEIRRIHKVEL